jgi:hypothetical protein
MIRWLVGLDMPISFEVVGNRMLAYQRKAPAAGLAPLIGVLMAFRQRIPRVAWNLYPDLVTPRGAVAGTIRNGRGILPGPLERREG